MIINEHTFKQRASSLLFVQVHAHVFSLNIWKRLLHDPEFRHAHMHPRGSSTNNGTTPFGSNRFVSTLYLSFVNRSVLKTILVGLHSCFSDVLQHPVQRMRRIYSGEYFVDELVFVSSVRKWTTPIDMLQSGDSVKPSLSSM